MSDPVDVYSETDPELGTRHVLLRRTEEGALMLEGQDLGRGVSSVFGDDLTEYEWTFTLASDRVAGVLNALGIAADSPESLERLAERLSAMEPREMQMLFEEAGATFWSRIGDLAR